MIEYLISLSLSVVSALFATVIMSYIAMAVPLGPWIDATLVLLLSIVVKLSLPTTRFKQHKIIALSTAAGGIAGIVATGCAFSFPTLYFLDKALFEDMLAYPAYFCLVMGGLVLLAGALGLIMAHFLEQQLIERQGLAFPIGTMVQKIITAQDQAKKSGSLLLGGISSCIFLVLQQPLFGKRALLPKIATLTKKIVVGSDNISIEIPSLTLQLCVLPLLISIGFIAGHMIAIPLIVGAIAKIILQPIQKLLFFKQDWNDFVLAFCGGMVLQGVIYSFSGLPNVLRRLKKNSCSYTSFNRNHMLSVPRVAVLAVFAISYSAFMFQLGLPFLAQIFLLIGALICTYQLSVIGGTIGLAPLGRFATFVMIPGVLLFGAEPLMATVLAMFVEVAGGAAVDALFGLKTASLLELDGKEMRVAQWLGLITASLSIGIIFYLLITHLHLGSEQLFAQKAQTRALLLHFPAFDIKVLLGGFAFGLLLKKFKINPMFVLTGILMPLDYSLGLILGGITALLLKDTDRYTPFFSGAFCINSLWIILEAFFLR